MIILATAGWLHIADAVQTIAIFAAMPTLIVWLCLKANNLKLEKRMELVKMAVEKDPSLDLEEFLSKLTPVRKNYAQKNATSLLLACILIFFGLGLVAVAVYCYVADINDEAVVLFGVMAGVVFATGLGFLISFFYRDRLIRKGILK